VSPTSRIRTLIVDDEAIARSSLRRLLEADPDIAVVGESYGAETVDAVLGLRPDLMFLDVLMPEMTGFEVLARIPQDALPLVVFVTAYDEYATKAFDEEAVDYLLKPYSTGRFSEALARAKRALATRGSLARHQQLLAKVASEALESRIVVTDGGKSLFFRPQEVLYLKASGVYVEIRTRRGTQLAREGISSLESRLDPATFIRVHRSAIVNKDHVIEFRPQSHGDGEVLMRDDVVLPVSRARREPLQLALGLRR